MKHKFNAIKCELDGIKFGSKKEASYYLKLKQLKEKGDILFFLRQVPFHLPGNIVYRMDFIEFWKSENGESGDIIFTEVKGFKTTVGEIKIKQCQSLYNIKINIV